MVHLAVLNATARTSRGLDGAIARMEASSGDSESFTLWDEEFHQLISEATRNPLMVWVYRQINAVRTHRQWNAMKDKVLTPQRIAEYNRQHAALYEAIRSTRYRGGRGHRHRSFALRQTSADGGRFGRRAVAVNPAGRARR